MGVGAAGSTGGGDTVRMAHLTGRQRKADGRRRAERILSIFRARFPRVTAEESPADRERQLHLYAETRKPCSGPCCGNPRRHFGKLTVQERRQEVTVGVWR